MKHLRYDLLWWAYNEDNKEDEAMPHPQKQMRSLGITFQHSTPQSLGDQWWFWCCKNIPEPLPPYLSILDADPMKCIGYGLSEEDAIKIMNCTPLKIKE